MESSKKNQRRYHYSLSLREEIMEEFSRAGLFPEPIEGRSSHYRIYDWTDVEVARLYTARSLERNNVLCVYLEVLEPEHTAIMRFARRYQRCPK